MITDLHRIPDPDQLKTFIVKFGGSPISTRQKLEICEVGKDSDNEVKDYISYTSITKLVGTINDGNSVLVNYVTKCVKRLYLDSTSVFDDDQFEKSFEDASLHYSLCGEGIEHFNSTGIVHYVISLYTESEEKDGAGKDHCIFCNNAFVGIRNKKSLEVISLINSMLSDLEISQAKTKYKNLKYAKDNNGQSLIPHIEDFEPKEINCGNPYDKNIPGVTIT